MDKSFWKNQQVLITGGHGFLGNHLVAKLQRLKLRRLFVPSHHELDLRLTENCQKAVNNIDIAIHLAGVVGGIDYNQRSPGKIFYDNLIMGAQLMEVARKAGTKKFVSLSTVCAYPKFTSIPFSEDNLWDGYPEETNAPYGLAKKMLLVQGQAYRSQYGFNAITLFPTNFYGPGDHFDHTSPHVIPALINKFAKAKAEHKKTVTVWGTGRPTRDFLYIVDAAEGIILATERYNKPDPVNLGSNLEISIRKLAELIHHLIGFQGRLVWDTSKPDGQPRRRVDASRAKKEFGFEARTDFETGLKKTIDWYLESQGAK